MCGYVFSPRCCILGSCSNLLFIYPFCNWGIFIALLICFKSNPCCPQCLLQFFIKYFQFENTKWALTHFLNFIYSTLDLCLNPWAIQAFSVYFTRYSEFSNFENPSRALHPLSNFSIQFSQLWLNKRTLFNNFQFVSTVSCNSLNGPRNVNLTSSFL